MSDKIYAGIGNREIPLSAFQELNKLARNFDKQGFLLRSGGAMGSDTAFQNGSEHHIIYKTDETIIHNGTDITIEQSICNNKELRRIAKEHYPFWDNSPPGTRDLMTRNVAILLGPNVDSKARMVVCYCRDEDSGGTAMGIRVAKEYGIPVYNLFNENIRQIFLTKGFLS